MGKRQRLELPAEPTSAARARAFVAEHVPADGANGADLALMVSELATNAILHARTPFVVEVHQTTGLVRVAVSDGSPSEPRMKVYDGASVTGRGLRIIEACALRWGVDHAVDGKTVWFEVSTSDELTGTTGAGVP